MPVVFNPFTGNLDLIDNTAAAGSDTQVQFNDGGVLGGDSGLVFNKTTNALTGGAFIPAGSSVPANGIYLPAANTVALSTASTGRLFISDDGKIGIGTATPSAYAIQADDLVIAPSTSTAGISLVATAGSLIYFSDLDAEGRGVINYNHGDDSFRFSTAASQRLAITSDGSVNIVGAGTAGVTQAVSFNGSAPVDSLVINSSGNVSTAGTMTAGSFIPTSSTVPANGVYLPGTNQLALSTNGTGRLFVDADGNVGFGVSSPERPIHLPDGGVLLLGTTAATGTQIAHSASSNLTINNKEAGAQIFYTSDTERLRITSAGLVGIGSSSPQATLQVLNPTSTQEYLRVGANSAAQERSLRFSTYTVSGSVDTGHLINAPGTSGNINGQIAFATNGTTALTIDSSQRVGIGTTSPAAQLNVSQSTGSDIVKLNGLNGYDLLISNTQDSGTLYNFNIGSGSGAFSFSTSAGERARIDSSGRLLVGTPSDSGGALLQVNGDRVRIATAKTPASATDTGTTGEVCWDANYVYVCTATNTWKRAALSTW